MSITDSNQRVAWIDNLKAFVIFLVVLGHSGLKDKSQVIAIIITWIYEFHMPLFFLLSGVSFSIVQKRGGKFVNKQILNIILIFFIQSVFYILFNMLVHHLFNIQPSVETNFSNLYTFFIWPVGEFWYLHALIIIYIVELLITTLVKDDRVKMVIVVILAFGGMMTSIGILSKALYELLFFECGRQILSVKKTPIWISAIGVVASIVVPFVTMEGIFITRLLTVMIALTMSIFLVCIFSKCFDTNLGIITIIGQSCLWIYLFHTYFTNVSRNICNRVIPTLPIVSTVIITIIGVAGPLVTMYIFKIIRIDRIVTRPVSFLKNDI